MFDYLCSRYKSGLITEAMVYFWVGRPAGITQEQADLIIASGGDCGDWEIQMIAAASAQVAEEA